MPWNLPQSFMGDDYLTSIFLVEDCPSILAKGNTLRISSDELKSVQSFITLNKEIFLKYMNDTHFGMHDFFAAMKLSS